jgi:hypothetical protein
VISIQQVLLAGVACFLIGFVWNAFRRFGATRAAQVVGVTTNGLALIAIAGLAPPFNLFFGVVPIATLLVGEPVLMASHAVIPRAGVWHTYRRLFRDIRAERAVPPAEGAVLHARVQRDVMELERWRTAETSTLIDRMAEYADLATTPDAPKEEVGAAVERLHREMRAIWGWPVDQAESEPPKRP